MPQYRVTLSDGRIVTVESDHAPTPDEVLAAMAPQPVASHDDEGSDRSVFAPAGEPGALVGGTVGAIAGGPVGSALGGAAGLGYQRLWENARDLPGIVADTARLVANPETRGATVSGFGRGALEGATEAGIAGGVQGASDAAAGAVASRVLAPAARFMMNTAIRPGLRVVGNAGKVLAGPGKTLSARFPGVDINEELLKRGVPIRNKGLRQMQSALKSSRGKAMQAITDTSAAPVGIDELMSPVVAKQAAIKAGTVPRRARTLSRFADEFRTAHPAPKTIAETQGLKDEAADAAAQLYRTGKGSSEAVFNEQLARGARGAIEARVPNIRALNEATQHDLALRDALLTALDRESRSGRMNLSGLLDNPRLWGMAAHGAKNTGRAVQQIPNAVRGALLAALANLNLGEGQ